MLTGLMQIGFTPTRMQSPTRIGNSRQRDTNVDFFVTNSLRRVVDVDVGDRYSDHHLISCSFTFPGFSTARRRVVDFRRTHQSESHLRDLVDGFEGIDWRDLFVDASLDELAGLVESCIHGIWIDRAVCKWISNESRPWFTPKVKRLRSEARRWERLYRRMVRDGTDTYLSKGLVYSKDQCQTLMKRAWDAHIQEMQSIMDDCNGYIKAAEFGIYLKVYTGIYL